MMNSSTPSGENGHSHNNLPHKIFKDSSGVVRDASTVVSSSYLCLNGGEVLIKGNGIEMTAPCDIRSITMDK